MKLNRLWSVLLILFIIGCGCGRSEYLSPKEFLIKNPNVTLRIDNGPAYDKYLSPVAYRSRHLCGSFITLKTPKDSEELILTNEWQSILSGKYSVRVARGTWAVKGLIFSQAPVHAKTKLKTKEITMSLSLGTWIMLILVMIIIAKLVHLVTLKNLFKPAKRSVKRIKDDWDDA